jgi:DNA mismatch endonuclease (patch repair protein)
MQGSENWPSKPLKWSQLADVFTPGKRSEVMSRIRGRDTRPELVIRRGLHARGFRYRLYDRRLPGRPDLVFPKFRAVILVNGCFWHGHDCHLFRLPETRHDFWKQKIDSNRHRDARNLQLLLEASWRVMIVWECALKGRTRLPEEAVITSVAEWLGEDADVSEIRGCSQGRTVCDHETSQKWRIRSQESQNRCHDNLEPT